MPTTAAGQPVPASRGWLGWATAPAQRLAALPRWLAALPGRLMALARRTPALAREHWLLALLLAAGLVLRTAAQIAYRPALFYIDSMKYLFGAYPGNDPPGYQILIKPVLAVADPSLIAAIQHVLGLAMAVVLYVVLLRRGVPRWLAALATAPVLLDAYQLQIEQTIMPDVMFEACIVAGLAALLWQPRPRTALIVTGGLFLGASATARQVGEIFILPALAYLLVALPNWRRRLIQCAVVCAAFAVPILAASFRNEVAIHRFALAPYSGGSIYGRMAAAADCATLKLPSYERALCPPPRLQRNGPDWLDHQVGSPIKSFQAPAALTNGAVVSNFTHRVLLQQPGRVLAAIGKDALKLYAVDRVTAPGDTSVSRWQFQPSYPQYPPYMTIFSGQVLFRSFSSTGQVRWIWSAQEFGGGSPVVARPLAAFLHAYQVDGGYTPGPLLALMTLAGLAGTLSLVRRRATPAQRHAAQACLLTFTAAAAVLLISDAFEFSWRYQLPALITLPPAAALAITALFIHRHDGSRQPAEAVLPPGSKTDVATPGASRANGQPQARDRTPAS
ncbi:MAG TPA: phospholipid carrier-dependent glycosyltransferase [Streptosporangiaceae bacterium]|nr:phospholipid carrier-dependent glycosyltransferase [Streptosporangiaceae bacterium]